MCAVIGVVAREAIQQMLLDGLTVLQHRGQDAAGVAVMDGDQILCRKGEGLVREVFHAQDVQVLSGQMGVGHVRYPTSGGRSWAEAQPFCLEAPWGQVALVHNGNLTNTQDLRQQIEAPLTTESDSEILLHLLVDALGHTPPTPERVFAAIHTIHQRCQGAYAVVALVPHVGLIAFRDPHGIRPLVLGQRAHPDGHTDVMVASESVAFQAADVTLLEDLPPGEGVIINAQGQIRRQASDRPTCRMPCLFEFVYLARPASVIEGVSVYEARWQVGHAMADFLRADPRMKEVSCVIPIPETSRHIAIPMALGLGLAYREGFDKNRYIGRTFIMPTQALRKHAVQKKLNIIAQEFKNKTVLLVDDSIVRGTTSREIIQMAREAGAKKVFLASAAPPVRFPNRYGIDMPEATDLIAHGRTEEEVAQAIGADALWFLPLQAWRSVLQALNPQLLHLEASVFDGHYVTEEEPPNQHMCE